MSSTPRDPAYLLDILLAARQAAIYAEGLDRKGFEASRLHQDAILRQLTIVGEAASRISEPFRESHPEVPWSSIRGFRNIVVHAYFEVDLDQVWQILQVDIPELIDLINPLLDERKPPS